MLGRHIQPWTEEGKDTDQPSSGDTSSPGGGEAATRTKRPRRLRRLRSSGDSGDSGARETHPAPEGGRQRHGPRGRGD